MVALSVFLTDLFGVCQKHHLGLERRTLQFLYSLVIPEFELLASLMQSQSIYLFGSHP